MAAKAPEPPKAAAQGAAPGNAVARVAAPAVVAATPPTAASGTRPSVARRDRSGGVASVIAVCSLLVAMGSTVIAIYSLNVARQAKSRAAAAASALDRATAPGKTPSAPTSPSPAGAPTAVPTLGPTYVADRVRADLRIPAAEDCISIFVDVDTMQTGIETGHEFYLSGCLGPLSIRVDRTKAAAASPVSLTPEACAAALANPSATGHLNMSVYSGLTFCLLTSTDFTLNPGQPQRLAIVEIQAINPDHSLNAVVSTYRVAA